jgi:D-galacturonate reductase
MIANDQILPSLYHMQRTGRIGEIEICARHNKPLRELAGNPAFGEAFPGQRFTPHPSFDTAPDEYFPEMYKEVIAALPPRQVVLIAVPDQFHYPILKTALEHDQHVLCVKPLVLRYAEGMEIKAMARERGLFVGVEYHKRFDRRALLARKEYGKGHFGEFRIGSARMIEPYYYRDSNFQNWFTCDQTDPFVYVGCHYVDQVYFITGLKPASVSVTGVKGTFPNGNEAYMWANGRVVFENGAVLSVDSGLGYPNDGAGSNDQGLSMICEGPGKSALIQHDDQYRGVRYSFLDSIGPGGSAYNYVSPDYFKLVPHVGPGLKPVGYGYESIEAILEAAIRIENDTAGHSGDAARSARQKMIDAIDAQGLLATPANSWINELVFEAARISILRDGLQVDILYDGTPRVEARGA